MTAGADLTADPRGTADRIVGDCHYCEGIVVLRFMGQLGSREVWGQTHAGYAYVGHDARTSAEIWAELEDYALGFIRPADDSYADLDEG